jgi:hypothetical protein
MAAVEKISFAVSPEEKDLVNEISEMFGITQADVWKRALFHTYHDLIISKMSISRKWGD